MSDTSQENAGKLEMLKSMERRSVWGERMSWTLTVISLVSFAFYVYTLSILSLNTLQIASFIGCMILSCMALRGALQIRKSTREVRETVRREVHSIEARRQSSEEVAA